MEQDMKAAATRIRTIDLGHEQMMIFDDGRGERVRVLYGVTWLTQEGDASDAVLRPGAERALRDGRSLIEALQPSRLEILGPPVRSRSPLRGLPGRVRHWIRRLQLGPVLPKPVC
jgi:hypothetical protein